MQRIFQYTVVFVFFFLVSAENHPGSKIRLPYKREGLSKREAAAHLLSRLTYGARPGDIDAMLEIGLENWVAQQISGNLEDNTLNQMLKTYDALSFDNEQVVNTFMNPGQFLRRTQADGMLSKKEATQMDKKDYRDELKKQMEKEGKRLPAALNRQLINQKIIRAVYSNNQLHEVMTDFWFNHFNVSVTKGQSQYFVLSYERDVIRPQVFGKFEQLLKSTARHPAMLTYLDNARSVIKDKSGKGGLNENYAREVMELHTLGVDGGYTQQDVTEVARALTGWTLRPLGKDNPYAKQLKSADPAKIRKRGFVVEGDFLFRSSGHDEKEKTILGKKFPPHGGYQEGLDVLSLLASHPSTATFISKKLATRFVSDTPSTALVSEMAEVFRTTGGDIREVFIAMLNSREFWKKSTLHAKIKSPFAFMVSALRATGAEVRAPYPLFDWSARMGEKIYHCAAPTGFPDRASYWISSGSLLNRMNFGLALAAQKLTGVKPDLAVVGEIERKNGRSAGIYIGSPEFQRK